MVQYGYTVNLTEKTLQVHDLLYWLAKEANMFGGQKNILSGAKDDEQSTAVAVMDIDDVHRVSPKTSILTSIVCQIFIK